ncbi:SDR family NAD(P)-dependent oxidoreductase [Methyloversatilis universalis]|uniref:SDR family NAD(P)-dependent oxidoreductase n=1 Tax=Methyloversatilis universalis TaxID=378211 RepID=UPI000366E251|nr:SDR family NAD(P)-dependent oxidoreductase [Methyloversatilis universalis]
MDPQKEGLLAWIIERLAEVLGHDASRIHAYSALEELGLESMSVVAMGRVLEAHFPLLSKTFLYDCRTVGDVPDYLLSRFPDEAARLSASLRPAAGAAAALPRFSDEWVTLDDEGCAATGVTDLTIAIVGVAGRYPGAENLESFAEALEAGRDAITEVPAERWSADGLFSRDPVARAQWASMSKWGGFLRDVDAFDSAFFGVSAVDADVMDPQERLFIECAWHALEHAGLGPERLPRTQPGGAARVGVFAGITTLSYPLLGEAHWRSGGGQVPTAMPWSVANRLSWLLDFDGPSVALDTACSSSLTALHLACESLRRDECAVALAGGVNLYLHPSKYVQLSQQRMLSPTGRCHAFGDAADGFVPGEGVGVVVLRRLADARAAGDRILGVIRATGIAHGGRTTGYTVPSSRSQAALIRDTLERAGLDGTRIGYVEAHGTGTRLGDPVEVEGLLEAWGTARPQRCGLGSVKTNIGHLESAAGVAGLTKLLLQFRARTLFPSLHSARINPAVDLARTPFHIPQRGEPWPDGERPRCAALSSFGAGGANAHVLVEEWAGTPTDVAGGPLAHLFPFSASDDEQLDAVIARFRDWLAPRMRDLDNPAGRARIAATLQLGRTPQRARALVTAATLAELLRKLTGDDMQRGAASVAGNAAAQPDADTADPLVIAARWLAGAPVRWATGWPVQPRPVDLPGYPFRRTRHWIGGGQAAAAVRFDSAVTPDPAPDALRIEPDDWRARNHVVDGHAVFPAAGFLQLLAATLPGSGALEFRDLMWGRPLVLDAPATLRLERQADGRCAVHGAPGDGASAHLRGTLHAATACDAASTMAIGRPSAPFDRDAFYARFERMGLAYGPDFRPVQSLVREADHALAELSVSQRDGVGRFDPALLDGVFQCAVALAPESVLSSGRAFVPFSMRRFTLHAPLPGRVRVRIDYRGTPAPGLHAFDFRACDDGGTVLADIEGFCFRAWDGARSAPLHLLQRSWTACEALRPVALPTGPLLLAAGAGVRLDGLESRLRRLHPVQTLWRVDTAPRFRFHDDSRVDMDATDPAHRRALLELLQHRDAFPDTVVWLAGSARDMVEADVRRFVALAQLLVGALGARALRLVYVGTPSADDARCFHAAMGGLLKSLHLEAPRVSAVLLELDAATLDDPVRRADAIAAALAHPASPGHAPRLRVQDGRLEEARFAWLHAPADGWQPTRGATYLITGGMGALGRTFARWLAGCGVHVALLGRSPLDEEGARIVAALGGDGTSVIYVQGDATDAVSLAGALQQVRATLGPVRGVIHAAGVLRDAFFVKHGDDDWQAVLAPKITAARLLDEATRDDPLEAFVLFSSLAGAHGNVGQSVYAYANAWLDDYAGLRAQAVAAGRRSGRTLALAWPLWRSEDGMQAPPPVMQWMAERGLELLDAEQGIQALRAAMASTVADVVVCSGRREGVARLMNVDDGTSGDTPPAAASVPVELPAGDVVPALCGRLGDMLARACGIARARITPGTPLQSLGLDSIMVMDLNGELDTHFASLPKTLLYEADTVQDLASRIIASEPQAAARFAGADAPTPAAAPAMIMPSPVPSSPLSAQSKPEPATTPPDDAHGLAIAIVGMAGRYPRAADTDAFWDNLLQGMDCVGELSQRWPDDPAFARREGEAAKTGAYARWAALIDQHDCFDPLFFGIAPRDAERMDPQERLFLETSWLAIENAGYTPQTLQSPQSRAGARARVGVLAGVMYGEYQYYGAGGSATLTNSSYAAIANRVSYTLGFSGASFALDSMCSSSLTALHTACLLLRAGECDAVLAGGVNLSSHPYRYRMLSELQFAASDGRCRSFGAGGDGYVPGEGVGVVVLKRLADALRDGDHIHGVIRGSALGHGGRTSGFTVPTPVGQSEVIADAFAGAGVPASRLGYIEAHGTGTGLGDPIELRGLAMALEGALEGQVVPIGSVKSQIGHLESAAGIAALTKVLLQMRHGRLAPSIHSEPANPNIDFSKLPFRVQAAAADWPAPRDPAGRPLPRLAAVSSFGAGGSNAHIVVEEWPAVTLPDLPGPHIVVLSARTPDTLRTMAQSLAVHVERAVQRGETLSLADLAATLRVARVAQPNRLALIADDLPSLVARLRASLAGEFWQLDASVLPPGVFKGVADAESAPAPVGGAPDTLARAWVSGAFDDWNAQAVPQLRRRVPLPGTAFQRRRFWAQPVVASPVMKIEQPVAAYAAAPTPPREVPAHVAPVLSPRDILERVKTGRMTPDEAKRLLAGMRATADQ